MLYKFVLIVLASVLLAALASSGTSSPAAVADAVAAAPTPFNATTMKYVQYGSKANSDTCAQPGDHTFCCEAPGGDPNNCPDSARTPDCDAKGSCCCA